MKILKKLSCLIVMVFMLSVFILTGCGGLKDNPPSTATVYSNGGMTVVKGEYLYYVNGYVNKDDLKDAKTQNVKGKVVKGAIYRTKLVDGDIVKDKDGFVRNAEGKSVTERVVSKIVGFNNGGFYIIDDFIYYATPCMTYSSKTEDTSAALQKDLVEFHRVKIDGTDDKLIYTTTESSEDLNWNVTKIDGKVYIVSFTGKTIMVANATDRKVVSKVENVTSCAIPKTTMSDANLNASTHKTIYFTRDKIDSDNLSTNYKGNVICSVDVVGGATNVVKYDDATKYAFKEAKNNAVYYTKNNVVNGDNFLLYKNSLNGSSFTSSTETELTSLDIENFAILDSTSGTNQVVGIHSSGKLYRFTSVDGMSDISCELLYTATSSTKFVGLDGDIVYIADGNKIHSLNAMADVSSGEANATLVSEEDYVYLVTNSHFFDYTSRFLFTYREFKKGDTTHYYLTYIDTENGYEARFVGEFDANETPDKPEQKEGYDADDPTCEIEYTPWID